VKYDPDQLYQLISDVIDNRPRLREWDDLLSLEHDDPFTEEMAQRLLSIQDAHSDIGNGILFDDEGVKELKAILEELSGDNSATDEQKPE
jgi:hypothetical protein